MYYDTHAHLYLGHFDNDIDVVIRNAKEAHIDRIYLPNIDSSTLDLMTALESKDNDLFRSMIGLHPCSVKEGFENELIILESLIEKYRFAGIGETGTDLYWDKSFRDEQIIAFETHLDWGLKYDLPVIIHARESMDLTIDIVRKKQNGNLKGIFHCFSGTYDDACQVIDLGFLMGIGGVITYKKNDLVEIIEKIELKHFVLETDSPYLPPVPHRGKRNESSYLTFIAKKIAEIKNMTEEEIGQITSRNADRIFSF
ncbi:MAG: TatD family hydrolase [Deltaproteobacteria bacterium]